MGTTITPPPGYENYTPVAPPSLSIQPPAGYEGYKPVAGQSVITTPNYTDDRSEAQKVFAGLLTGGIGNNAEDLWGLVKAAGNPVEALKLITQNTKEGLNRATKSFNEGDYSKGLEHLSGAVPMWGPNIESVISGIGDPNVDTEEMARRVGHAIVPMLGVAAAQTPEVVNALKSVGGKIGDKFHANTTNTIINALDLKGPKWAAPITTADGGTYTNLAQAVGDIKRNASSPITSVEHLVHPKFSDDSQVAPALTENRGLFGRWMDRGKQLNPNGLDGTSVVQAGINSIDDSVKGPKRQAMIDDLNNQYSGNRSIDYWEGRLDHLNNKLKPFYSKDEAVKAAAIAKGAETGESEAFLTSQVDEIRNKLYNAADPEHEGRIPREVQLRMGNMLDLINETTGGRSGALGETAGSTASKTAKAALAGVDLAGAPFKEGGLAEGLSKIPQQFTGKTDAAIARAFRNARYTLPMPEPPPVPAASGAMNAPRVISDLYNVGQRPQLQLGPSRTIYSVPELNTEGMTPEQASAARAAWQENFRNVGPRVIITPDTSVGQILQPGTTGLGFRTGFPANAPRQIEAPNPNAPRNWVRPEQQMPANNETLFTDSGTLTKNPETGRFEKRNIQAQAVGEPSPEVTPATPNPGEGYLHVRDGVLYRKEPGEYGRDVRLGPKDEARERLRQGKSLRLRDMMNGETK